MNDKLDIPEVTPVSDEELAERALDGLRNRLEVPESIEPVIKEEALKLAKRGVPRDSIFQRIFGLFKRFFGGLAEKIVDEAIDQVEEEVEGVVDRTSDDVDKFIDDQFERIRGRTRRIF